VRPVVTDVTDLLPPRPPVMLVMVSRVSWAPTGMAIVIAKDVLSVFVARVVGVAGCPGLSSIASRPNLEVFGHIKDDVLMAKNIPRNVANFSGCLDAQCMVNYKWVLFYHPQRDVQVILEIVPAVLSRRAQDSSEPRSHGAT